MTKDPNFPAMMFHPETGAATVFKSAGEVPEGYLSFHPKDPARKAKDALEAAKVVDAKPAPAAPVKLPLTRKEIVAALEAGGVTFDKDARVDALYEVLTKAVKDALAAAEVEYDPNLDTKALLALLPDPA